MFHMERLIKNVLLLVENTECEIFRMFPFLFYFFSFKVIQVTN